ncbi:MAG: NAD(P)-dependent oxidoreductase [Candidatus Daviesbacteria bacterium]|nr:MAG: NAD(P)-dependent oxidoreductase [Candidatus Daviesbacteria bacterium]
MNTTEVKTRIGVVGTGYIAQGLSYILKNDNALSISRVLTRRNPEFVRDLAIENQQITNSTQELIDNSDLLVECSGDPIHATEVLSKVMDAGIPVVTMDSELQLTSGSWLSKKGLITEAEGDQPGSLTALYKDALAMGFNPIVLGNIKGFLNHIPTKDEMNYWAVRNGISLEQVTSFTDGTKVQIEQALVANGLGAQILQRNLAGIECVDYQDGAKILAEKADFLGVKISDYVLSPKSPAGVFVVGKHEEEQVPFLRYYKLGEGPYYVLTKPFHLCHLEIPKTIRQVLKGGGILLNNGENPQISVATVAKRELKPGETFKRGIGSFVVRGEAINIADYPDHLPIGLAFNVVLKRSIEPGQIISFTDVEIPESQALLAWQEITHQK